MDLARLSLSLFGLVAIVAAALAGATIWLLLTDPVTVADAINQGEVMPLVRELAEALLGVLQGLLRWL
jgi:ABC-type cobalamin/Fe3+-siderophores transport system ATPase subunit